MNPVFHRVHTNTGAAVSELELLKRGIQGQLAEQEAARNKSHELQVAAVAVERPSSTRQLVDKLRVAGGYVGVEDAEQAGGQTFLTEGAMDQDTSAERRVEADNERDVGVQEPAWAHEDQVAGLFTMHEQPCFCSMCNPAISYPLKVSKTC